MRLFACIAVLMAASCTTVTAEREPFSLDAFFENAPAYVSSHYRQSELPAALIADLTAANFECERGAAASTCSRTHRATNCFYVDMVSIFPDRPVEAERDQPRCMGAVAP